MRRFAQMSLVVVGLVAAGLACATSAEPTNDSLQTIQDNIAKKKAILVDVREDSEWKAGHLFGAISVPLSSLKAVDAADKDLAKELAAVLEQQMPKDRILYSHCASGVRSLAAADILKKLGYDVRPLRPGYQQLLDAGFAKAK